MSKRHNVHRRKSYGRRQHEVRERVSRGAPDGDGAWDEESTERWPAERFAFLDPSVGRLRFALGE